jgi:NAD(P)-dependent dehydrogenase (short-subunit alcohol dehydrogenase family)
MSGADTSQVGVALRGLLSMASFPALGYLLRRRRWDDADTAVDMTGKICVVTGGSRGIGLAIARALAVRGATVTILCRDGTRGAEARDAIDAECRGAGTAGRAYVEPVDVASVGAVRDFVARFRTRFARLDVLVNNAGAFFASRRRSADGLELTFATNVLGGFHLTHALFPLLSAAAPARVIHMGSAAQYFRALDVDELLSNDRPYLGEWVYAHSKRALCELNERWAAHLCRAGVTSNCTHPGLVATPGVEHGFPLYNRLFGRLLRDLDQGADTAVWLATSRAAAGVTGKLWFDRAAQPSHLLPFTRCRPAEVDRLWEACLSLSITGTHAGAGAEAP